MSRQEDFKQASQSLEVQVTSNPWTLFEKGCEHGYQYAQTHPNWISVEEELPPHRNQTKHKFENDFSVNCFVSDGKDVDTGYYDYRLRKWNCEFLTNVVYWYCPQPPRKKE